MTRPEDRLYILTSSPPGKTENISSLPAIFARHLQMKGLWQREKSEYEFGQRITHQEISPERAEESLILKSFISEDWRKKIRIRSRAPEMWDMENPMGKTHFGNQVHTLLSKINTFIDIEPSIEEAVNTGLIAADDLELVRQMLKGILNHPDLGPLYSDTVLVKTEPEILLPDGKVYRPDRVVFINGIPTVVEYKTGKKEDSHLRQLETYEKLLLEMGYDQVKKILVYLHEKIEVIILQDGQS